MAKYLRKIFILLKHSNMKILKTCLVILCLLHVRAVGMPQFNGATFFMKVIMKIFDLVNSKTWHVND